MSDSAWRDRSREVITRTLADRGATLSVKEARKLLREAYPFGQRSMWPYTCWCLEVRIALAALAKLRGEEPPRGKLPQPRIPGQVSDIPGQLLLGGGTGR